MLLLLVKGHNCVGFLLAGCFVSYFFFRVFCCWCGGGGRVFGRGGVVQQKVKEKLVGFGSATSFFLAARMNLRVVFHEPAQGNPGVCVRPTDPPSTPCVGNRYSGSYDGRVRVLCLRSVRAGGCQTVRRGGGRSNERTNERAVCVCVCCSRRRTTNKQTNKHVLDIFFALDPLSFGGLCEIS